MELGIINLWNAIIIAIILIPNIIYVARTTDVIYKKMPIAINVLEQIGRYGSMMLMVLPLGMKEFGFPSVAEMFLYLFCNMVLLLIYLATWGLYFKKKNLTKAMILAIVPTLIFLITGITLRHILLMITAVIFGIAHSLITYENNKE